MQPLFYKNGDNLRYFAFSAEPEKSCTPSTLDFSEPAEKNTISSNSRRFKEFWGPRGILCTRGEKEQTSKRASVIACDNAISKTRFATRTRLRKNLPRNVKNPSNSRRFIGDIFSITCNALYVIASENTGPRRDTVYLWGLIASKF